MKRCVFYRTMLYRKTGKVRAVETNGFSENVNDSRGREITFCFHKENDGWVVTEKTTGLYLYENCSTRKEALEKAMERVDDVFHITQLEYNKDKIDIIRKAYANRDKIVAEKQQNDYQGKRARF